MPDLDSLLNFLYIVAFLAAMILPSFQRQRREEARKRAEAQRQAEEVPTVEERSPEDVPEPTIRRAAASAPEPAPSPAGGALVDLASMAPEPRSEREPRSAVDARPTAAAELAAAAAASKVGGSDLTDLDEVIDLTALDEEIDVTSIDDGERREDRSKVVSEEPARSEAAPRIAVGDPAALRQAVIFSELLQPPVALRRGRSVPPSF
ncbi:MAG: hypothetical protein JNM84_09505 [Planctomycetes bacterium]|nr:hypothetical protein [Planctomycetota bacterium]